MIDEDISAAPSITISQKITSRIKLWCVKDHFFWSHVNNTKNNTKYGIVDIKEQRADFLIEGLTKDIFHCHFLNQGWEEILSR